MGSVPTPHFEGRSPAYVVGVRCIAINAMSPHREEALSFLKYLAGEEYSRVVNQGRDGLPCNPEFAMTGVDPGDPNLGEAEMHQHVLDGMKHTYSQKKSPFLFMTDVDRILQTALDRMETRPELKIEEILSDAQKELELLMQRNLDRSPELLKKYQQLTGSSVVQQSSSSQIGSNLASYKAR